MRPEDLLFWLQATPFRPFRLLTVSGKSFDIRHPELVRLMRISLIVFTPAEQEAVYDRAEMMGLVVIERIEPLEMAAHS